MSINIGCIGCGNMGGAILGGLAKSGKGYALCGNTRTMKRMEPLVKLGVEPLESAADVARKSRYVVLAVKPYQVEAVLSGMKGALSADNVLISIAAGVSLDTLKKFSRGVCPVVRCMPNTPALVAKGVFAFSFEDSRLSEEQKRDILDIFSAHGQCFEVPESRFTAFTSLIGAGPAYLFDLMEGMVQAGVTLGFQHADCRRMVAALFEGCGRMALENSDTHLMALRDNVCSPAGTTIVGVNCMDEDGLAGKLAKAVFAANRRGIEMEG